jgi:hypothetical protein
MRGVLPRARLLWIVVPVAVFASTAHAAEGELEDAPPPSSALEIRTPIQRIITEPPKRMPARFPWIQQQLDKLPPFFADTELEARFRTYYLREDKTTDALSEAWAVGGSIYYRSGWLADLFQAEVEAFTSQPIVAPDSKDETLLLQPVQDGYSVLGIANGKLRHKGFELTGGRVYLNMPYINRQDNRMTPNTFEAISLQKPNGEFQFTTGYAWNIKLRNSDDFVSFSEAAGVDEDRGLAWGGATWDTNKNFHGGVWAGVVPDLAGKAYGELGVGRDLTGEWYGRIDGQFTYQFDIGDDLLGDATDDTWSLAIRAAASHAGAVIRVGMAFAGPNAFSGFYGSSASYGDLMQRTFNRPKEKALLASLSYDFSGLGADGLSVIVNFAAGFDGKVDGGRSDAQEVDVTIDYRVKKEGWMKSLWLRVRGSWLNDESADRDGTDVRVILRYDLPAT